MLDLKPPVNKSPNPKPFYIMLMLDLRGDNFYQIHFEWFSLVVFYLKKMDKKVPGNLTWAMLKKIDPALFDPLLKMTHFKTYQPVTLVPYP